MDVECHLYVGEGAKVTAKGEVTETSYGLVYVYIQRWLQYQSLETKLFSSVAQGESFRLYVTVSLAPVH